MIQRTLCSLAALMLPLLVACPALAGGGGGGGGVKAVTVPAFGPLGWIVVNAGLFLTFALLTLRRRR